MAADEKKIQLGTKMAAGVRRKYTHWGTKMAADVRRKRIWVRVDPERGEAGAKCADQATCKKGNDNQPVECRVAG